MQDKVLFEKTTFVLFLNDKKYALDIDNKTILKKKQIIVDDLNLLLQTYNEETKNLFLTILENFDVQKVTKQAIDLGKKLAELRLKDLDISKFSDTSKKTKRSIFFSEAEIREFLDLIGALKVLAFFMHSDLKEKFVPVLEDISKVYPDISAKVFSVIKARTFRFSQQDLAALRVILSMDFLILYNFDFIFVSVLPHYDWKRNPVTFAVSVSSENSNFLFLTYRSQQHVYSEEIETTVDILSSILNELILSNVEDRVVNEFGFQPTVMYPTPFTDIIAMPLFSLLSGIPVSYLLNKTPEQRLKYQFFLKHVVRRSHILKKIIQRGSQLFSYASSQPIASTERSPHPVVLEVLKWKYFGLESRNPLIKIATNLSSMIGKEEFLIHMANHSKFQGELESILKPVVKFLPYLVQDDKSWVDRETFLNVLKEIKIDSNLQA